MVIGLSPISASLSAVTLPNEAVASQNKLVEVIPPSVESSSSSKNQSAANGQDLAGSNQNTKTSELREQIFSPRSASDASSSDESPEDARAESQSANKSDAKSLEAQATQDRATIQNLASIDRKVKAHEQAHASVGGTFAGAPSFTYKTGPNGVRYAVAGEVPIDTSPASSPEATVRKAEQVARAALAPADPSPTDRRIASSAQALASKARIEIAQLVANRLSSTKTSNQPNINGDNTENSDPTLESNSSYSSSRLFAALATDATDQVGGQISASA